MYLDIERNLTSIILSLYDVHDRLTIVREAASGIRETGAVLSEL